MIRVNDSSNNQERANEESGWQEVPQHESINDVATRPVALPADDKGPAARPQNVPASPASIPSPFPYSYPPYYFPHGPYIPPLSYGGYPMTPPPNVLPSEPPIDLARELRPHKGGVVEPFPEKLHKMLDSCEHEGLADVVSFFSHGRAFAIHKPRRFVQEVMPRFFRQTKLTSFQRQLNLYGFKRISHGPDNGGYYHESFLKGKPTLASNMKRTKVKGNQSQGSHDPDSVPNFYIYPPINTSLAPAPADSTQTSSFAPPVYTGYPYPYAPYPTAGYPQLSSGGYTLPSSQSQAAISSAAPQPQTLPQYPVSIPYGYSAFPYHPVPIAEAISRVPQASPVQTALSLVKTRKQETPPKSSPSDCSLQMEGV